MKVLSLDQAKEFNLKGIRPCMKPSIFWHNTTWLKDPEFELRLDKVNSMDIPTYTLDELLDFIGMNYTTTDHEVGLYTVTKQEYYDLEPIDIHSEISKESVIDAAFKMILWLKENGRLS